MFHWDSLGITTPDRIALIQSGIAFGLTLIALCFSQWMASRWADKVTEYWHKWAGFHSPGFHERVVPLLRYGVGAVLLALIFVVDDWSGLARFIIGAGLAFSTGMFVKNVLRGLNVGRMLANIVGVSVFALLISVALGGYHQYVQTLSELGFTIGSRRISLLSVGNFALTVIAMYAAARLINRLTMHAIEDSKGLDPTQKVLGQKLATIAIVAIAAILTIDLFNIDLTSLTFFSGALGLAVGFGLQKTVGNMFAGIILLMDRSIKPGDVIAVGDSFGEVNRIGIRAMSVITREGKEHLIPNELLMTQEVVNWSYTNKDVRISINLTVSYDTDMDRAKALMVQAVTESPRVLNDPPANILMKSWGELGVDFEIRCWIVDPEMGVSNVRSDVLWRLWNLFKAEGIVIPFPQRELHIRSIPDDVTVLGPADGSVSVPSKSKGRTPKA